MSLQGNNKDVITTLIKIMNMTQNMKAITIKMGMVDIIKALKTTLGREIQEGVSLLKHSMICGVSLKSNRDVVMKKAIDAITTLTLTQAIGETTQIVKVNSPKT